MKNLKLFALFALITAALLFMFSCNKVEITNNPDDIYDEEKTDSNGLLVKEKTYPYGENDVLLLSVNNPTDKNLSITINISYFDNEKNLLKEDTRTYDQMYSGGGNNFIFNPEIGFDSYSYSISTEEYNGTVIAKDVSINFNNKFRRTVLPSFETGVQRGVVLANATFSYTGDLLSVWLGANFIIIDNTGELYGIFSTGETIVYPNSPNIRTPIVYESDTESVSVPDELNGNITVIYDLTKIKVEIETPPDEITTDLPDGFIMEEKEYKVGNETYSLIYVKNESGKDYQLQYRTRTYEDGNVIGYNVADVTICGRYSDGYENYLWLQKEAVIRNTDRQVQYEYEFFVSNATGQDLNLHMFFSNASKQTVDLPDGKKPAIVGEYTPQSDTTLNNVYISGSVIGLDESENVCCIGSIGDIFNDNSPKPIKLLYVDTDLSSIDAEEMKYIVAINMAISK